MNDNDVTGMPEGCRRFCPQNSHNMEARRQYARRWAPFKELA
jgi:hypothetical protein